MGQAGACPGTVNTVVWGIIGQGGACPRTVNTEVWGIMGQAGACPRAAVGHRGACACAVKSHGGASHPVWGFKNLKGRRVGVGTLGRGVPPASDKA